ncbi:hypothetical protein B9Z55_025412 [Caenorhabditis nigoni]|uniref:Uncharacterized protein n=1 Tax=Caenorhabditis nigoni TaxID=1611254 RepID=A0A2G5SYT9_9PELO|nr:hypothetical protein B9Z55_025412 [Caenorhabditis nigoni]
MNNRPKRSCVVSNINGKPPEASGANSRSRRQDLAKEATARASGNVKAAPLANKNAVVAAPTKNVASESSKTETVHDATTSKDASEQKVTKTPSRVMPARRCKDTLAEKMSTSEESAPNTKDSSSAKNEDFSGTGKTASTAECSSTSGDLLPKSSSEDPLQKKSSVLQPKIAEIEKSKEATKKDSLKKGILRLICPDLFEEEDFLPASSGKASVSTSNANKDAVKDDKKMGTSSTALPTTSQKTASKGDGFSVRDPTMDATKASTNGLQKEEKRSVIPVAANVLKEARKTTLNDVLKKAAHKEEPAPQKVKSVVSKSSLILKNEQMDSTSNCGTSVTPKKGYSEELRKLLPMHTSYTPSSSSSWNLTQKSNPTAQCSSSTSSKPIDPFKYPKCLISTPKSSRAGQSSSTSTPHLATTPAPYIPKLLRTATDVKQKKPRTPRNIFALPIFDEDRVDEPLMSRSSSRPTRYTGNFAKTTVVEDDEDDEKMDEEVESENEEDSESEETYKKPSIAEQREALIEKARRSEKRKSIVQRKKDEKYADKISREWERSEKRRKMVQKKREERQWREQQKELKEQERSDNAFANLQIRKLAHWKAQEKKYGVGRQKSMKETIKMLKIRAAAKKVQVRVPFKKFEEPNSSSISLLVPIQRFSRSEKHSEYFKQLENHYRSSPNFKALHAFAAEAAKFSEKHYFGSISDPYFKAQGLRCKWVDARYIGVGKKPDFGLDISNGDKMPSTWTQEIQKNLPERFYALEAKENLPKLVEAIGSKQFKLLDLTPEFSCLDSAKKMAKIEFVVDKFLLLLKMWKIQHKDMQYPRVVLYFFFVMESIVKTVPLQSKEAVIFDFVAGSKDTRYELVKNMLFWLPIHLGDLAGTCHVPQSETIDLARQMMAVLLDEWPIVMGMRLEDQDVLERIQLAAIRLECHNSMEKDEIQDWLPFFKPKNREGVEGVYSDVKEKRQKALRRVWASRKTTVEFGRLETTHPQRPIRRRCHSFAEFTDFENFPENTEPINVNPDGQWNMLWTSKFQGFRRIKYSCEGADVQE